MKGATSCQADVFEFVPRRFYFTTESTCVLFLSLSLFFYLRFCLQSVSKLPGLYPHLCNNKSALPYKLKSPQVRALQGGPAIRQRPSIQWTVASLGLKTAASSVPLAHWRMDKALDFTLLKEGESARGAMKSIDPSLNGFVRGFRLANHGWKSPLNKALLLSKELGQIHQREEGKDNDSSWPDVRRWLHLHAMRDHVNNSNNRQTDKQSFSSSFFCHLSLGIASCRSSYMWTDTWAFNVHTNLGQKSWVDSPAGWAIFLPKQSHNLLLTAFSLFHHRSEDSELNMRAAAPLTVYAPSFLYMSSCGWRIRVGTLAHLLSPLVVRRDLQGERRWNADWADLNINVVR